MDQIHFLRGLKNAKKLVHQIKFFVFFGQPISFSHFLVHQIYLTVFWSTKFFFCKTFYEFFPALIWDGITISQYVIKDKTFKSGTIGNESLKPIMSTLHSQRTLLISPLHKNPTANNLTSSQTPKSFFSKKYSNKAYTT